MFNNKKILITGGTGSFGKMCTEIIFKIFKPKKLIIFSKMFPKLMIRFSYQKT